MKSISKRESQVISEIRSRDMIIFTPKDITRTLGISKDNTYRIVQNMKDKDLIKTVEKGKYILTETYRELDIYEIVPEIFKPSYVAFWSALHFHGMTEQVPRTVFLVTTKRKKPLELEGQEIRYVSLKKQLFFGYERYDKVIVSDIEKTIIDCLRHPDNSGGVKHIFDSIPEDLDTEKIVDYCEMTQSSAIASRLGFILDQKGFRFEKSRLKDIIDTYTRLDPDKEKGRANSEWKLYVNRGLT